MIVSVYLAVQPNSTFPVFTPHSDYARAIDGLSNGVLWTALGILLLVLGLVSYATHKFRAKPGEATPKPVYGNVKLEIGYTVAFVIILGVISVFSIRAMQASDPPTGGSNNFEIVAHQWWWEVRYPGVGIVTANEIHIPVNQPQQVGLRSADVIHDFWVPELGRKMDVIPGVENRTWFAADTPGYIRGTVRRVLRAGACVDADPSDRTDSRGFRAMGTGATGCPCDSIEWASRGWRARFSTIELRKLPHHSWDTGEGENRS